MRELGVQSRFQLRERVRRKRYPLFALIFASAAMLILSRPSAEASVFEKARETLLDAASPLLEFFSGPIDAVHSVFGSISDYFGVIEENRALKAEIAELREFRWQAQTLRAEIDQLSKIANIQQPPQIDHIIANVVGEAQGPFIHAIIVDVGRNHSIIRGHAVIDERGLLGHVITVGATSSRVLLLSDLNSKIPVFVEGAELQGIMTGDYERPPKLEFIEGVDLSGLAVGQRVVTSGRGGVLPRGIPVGEILGLTNNEIRVALNSDYHRTNIVRVLRYSFPNDVDETATPALLTPIADEPRLEANPEAAAQAGVSQGAADGG